MEVTPAHLPFTFVYFGGHASKIICGRYLYKITLNSHNDKTWLNCKEHVHLISGLPGNAIKIHVAISSVNRNHETRPVTVLSPTAVLPGIPSKRNRVIWVVT